MEYEVRTQKAEAQPIEIVRGHATFATLPRDIRKLFDQFYAGFKGKGGLNVVFYSPLDANGEFEIGCGVQVESGGNAATPAGPVATATYFGPYDKMQAAHEAIRKWTREAGHTLTGISWEVYGHWSDDPANLRTDIFYLLRP